MPFNDNLPAENTDPWYAPLNTAWTNLKSFVNALESALAFKANAADLGTAAEEDIEAFATAMQGQLADEAVPQTRTVAGKALTANITLVKADVGLSNVDNTSDANKPVSTAQAAALADKADVTDIIVLGVLDDGEVPPAPGVYLRRPAP